jgi:hypothetical protein
MFVLSLIATSLDGTSFDRTIFVATTLSAAVFCAKLVVVIVAVIMNIDINAGAKVGAGSNTVAPFGRGGRTGFTGCRSEVRQNGLLLDLTLAQSGEVVGYGFFFVKSDLAGVGADESFIEDAAGKLVEVFVFESAQHAGADFCSVGDGIELEPALLALLAKFFSEGSHVRLLLGFRQHRDAIIIGEGGSGRQNWLSDGVTGGCGCTSGARR